MLQRIVIGLVLAGSIHGFVFPGDPVADGKAETPEVILRFATANDGHWRPASLGPFHGIFTTLHNSLIRSINDRDDIDLVVFNGDLVDRYDYIKWWNENNPGDTLDDVTSRFNISWLNEVRNIYDQLYPPYYVVQGNHDRASWEYWETIWEYPAHHHFTAGDYAFVLLTRHDDRLIYLPVDYAWLDTVFTMYRDFEGIFLFIHAGDSGVLNEAFHTFVGAYPNLRAVFHGHNHLSIVERHGRRYHFWNGNFMNPIIDFGYRVVEIFRGGEINTYFTDLAAQVNRDSVVIYTSVPGKVTLAVPEHESSIGTTGQTFIWHAPSPWASVYRFELSADEQFTTMLYSDTTVTDTTVSIETLPDSEIIWWRVAGGNELGWGEFSEPSSLTLLPVSTTAGEIPPQSFLLRQNFPNPFNPSTTIQYYVPVPGYVTIEIYSALGQLVMQAESTLHQPGTYNYQWNPGLSSGVYIYRLTALPLDPSHPPIVQEQRMVLVR